MNPVLLVGLFAFAWIAMTGAVGTVNLLFGGLLALVIVYLLRQHFTFAARIPRPGRALALMFLFLRELLVSAVTVAWLVIQPNPNKRLKPAIIAFPLKVRSDAEIVLLANLITLTPGTLSVDVSQDHTTLYIHALSVDDRDLFIASIANGFEARIIEAFA